MSTMLEQAISHIRAGEINKARSLLIEVLKQNPADVNAWLWMTKCVTEPEQKRYCFEKVLKIDSQNQYAIRGLRHLTKPVSPPMQPQESQPQPVQPVQKRGSGEVIILIAAVGVGVFLILLCLYALWVAR
jgi:hypothetical protein